MEAIARNRTLVAELEKLTSDFPNTQKHIKEVAVKMKTNAEVFNRKMVQDWLENKRWEPIDKNTYDADTQTTTTFQEMETQTLPWCIIQKTHWTHLRASRLWRPGRW